MKKINQHNFQEYFLLYVDDELNTQQRKEVEEFVLANEDTLAEFEMLKESKLIPEETFEMDKTFLFRREAGMINLSNAEGFCLLHLDNELNNKEEAALQKFLLQNPETALEFNLLKQTVLPKEKIEFVNKKVLYRTEKEKRRIIPFNWLRLAVAAAFIGVSALLWFLIPSGKNKITALENHTSIKKVSPIIPTKDPTNLLLKNEQKDTTLPDVALLTTKQSYQNKKEITQKENPVQKNKEENVLPKIKSQNQTSNDDVAQNKPVENDSRNSSIMQQPVATTGNINSNDSLQKIMDQRMADAEKKLQEVNKLYAANTQNETNVAHDAVYKELNTDDEGLYVGSVELNKNKVRSLLKKASRIFGGKAKEPADDGNL